MLVSTHSTGSVDKLDICADMLDILNALALKVPDVTCLAFTHLCTLVEEALTSHILPSLPVICVPTGYIVALAVGLGLLCRGGFIFTGVLNAGLEACKG